VARKALILARTIGWSFELADVEIEALYPQSMQGLSVAEFKAAMTECDAAMAKRSAEAAASGCVLRCVRARIDSLTRIDSWFEHVSIAGSNTCR
jgi:homoserine dehydrogenase